MNDGKILYLVGGVNGGGKSTYMDAVFAQNDIKVINTDRIAYEIGGDYSMASNTMAGKHIIKLLAEWPETGKPIVWETILTSKYVGRVVKDFRKHGYTIDLTYIFLDTLERHMERILSRFAEGEHYIPTPIVARRFAARRETFNNAIAQMDSWRMLYNANPWFEHVAFGHGSNKIITNKEIYSHFDNQVETSLPQLPNKIGFFARDQKIKT
jgi:predicted ABC-type ATPase